MVAADRGLKLLETTRSHAPPAARHNLQRSTLGDEYQAAQVRVYVEDTLPGDSSRPGDLLVLGSDVFPDAVDVTVVHPLHPSSLSAEDAPGAMAVEAEAAKLKASGHACEAAG